MHPINQTQSLVKVVKEVRQQLQWSHALQDPIYSQSATQLISKFPLQAFVFWFQIPPSPSCQQNITECLHPQHAGLRIQANLVSSKAP